MEKINISLKSWINQFKQKKKRELRKKIAVLYQATYDFYLTLYLADVAKNKKIDLPIFMYITKKIICASAQEKAIKAIKEHVTDLGIKRVNKCYKSYLKYKRGC